MGFKNDFFFVFKNKSPFLNCSSLKKFLKQIEADDIQSYLIYLKKRKEKENMKE